MLWWLVYLLKSLVVKAVCFDAVSKLSSIVLLLITWPCSLGCWELIQRALRWPSHLCYCEKTAEMCLLGHGGDGAPVQCQQCSSWACLCKENTWLCTHRGFPWGDKNMVGASVWLLKEMLFSALWRYNTFSGSLRKLSPAITTWVMHLLLPLSISEHFGFLEQRLHFLSDWWKAELFIRGAKSRDFILSCLRQ